MLNRLIISNIVLIERLNLEFGRGLNILTGETGAGKSILLDALALALGGRGDTGLIRHGCDTASVTAQFDTIPTGVRQILIDCGLDADDDILILRRTLGTDGKTRAWINDAPVSVKTLKSVGDALIEIHGQFENHALMDAATHRGTLDEFARGTVENFDAILTRARDAYGAYHAADKRLRELRDILDRAATEREFLEHNVAELSALNPQKGEEEELANRRADMMNAEKNAAILTEAVEAISPRGTSLDAQIFSVAHILERIKTDPNPYQAQIDALYDAAQTVAEVTGHLSPIDTDTDNLDSIEERLFAIRAAARKHHVPADELPAKLEQMTNQLNAIDNSDAELKKLESEMTGRRREFDNAATALTAARRDASIRLRERILGELPDLKLAQADFDVDIRPIAPSPDGADDVVFMIKTNPGTPFSPLHKTASGGEISRLMLAMRVVLTGGESTHTLVFDEIDTGISGATASAVGQRLAQLAQNGQALVITHSAQVAGYADLHFKIEKHSDGDTTTTTVTRICDDTRLNEIARIISGDHITPESIATAKTLMKK